MPDTYRFLIMTTDPVHIGTGGMRLGRVDNTIVREPGTNLPKIPGTALHGVIRAYAARRYGKIQCAGQGSKEGRKHCGRPTCPICYTFGSIQGEAGSFSGVVSITDARILLFPVYSMAGPVWVTNPEMLEDVDFGRDLNVSENKAKWSGISENKYLNLGWLMVEKEGDWTLPEDLKNKIPEEMQSRIVLVSPKLFSQIVNSNLEVRTSVSINPETGAAEEGALYSYESIPRSTILWFDVIVDDFRDEFPDSKKLEEWEKTLQGGNEDAKKKLLKRWRLWDENQNDEKLEAAVNRATNWVKEEKVQEGGQEKWRWKTKPMAGSVEQNPAGVVTAGLEWAEHLGIGGMGTRGFGRLKRINCVKIEKDRQKPCTEEIR